MHLLCPCGLRHSECKTLVLLWFLGRWQIWTGFFHVIDCNYFQSPTLWTELELILILIFADRTSPERFLSLCKRDFISQTGAVIWTVFLHSSIWKKRSLIKDISSPLESRSVHSELAASLISAETSANRKKWQLQSKRWISIYAAPDSERLWTTTQSHRSWLSLRVRAPKYFGFRTCWDLQHFLNKLLQKPGQRSGLYGEVQVNIQMALPSLVIATASSKINL